ELAKSAYPNGFTADSETMNVLNFSDLTQVISGELAQLGITLKPKILDVGAWIAKAYGPDKFTNVFCFVGEPIPDPSIYPGQVLGSKNTGAGQINLVKYAPPVVDTLIAAGLHETNHAKRFAIYSKLLQRIALDAAYIPLIQLDQEMALSKKFTWPGYN